MSSIKKFTDLTVWQRSHKFVVDVYSLTEKFPKSEQFALTTQIRRAAVSITSNIVEGFDRGSSKEFKRFLLIARASLSEVQNQLLIARDLNFIDTITFENMAKESVEIHKMINGMIKHLLTLKLANS